MWGLSRDTWVRIACWTAFSLIVIFGVRSCSSGSSGTVGNGIWILFFAGLIVAAYAARERGYLAITFAGLAVLIFLVLLGKFDGLFVWAVLGLLLIASAGIWGYTQTDGRMKSFIGLASGVVIIAWFYMFAQSTLKVDLGFMGDRITDAVNLIIGLLAIGIFAFAAWRRNWIFFILSFVVLAAWLGPDVFDQIQKRFPRQLSVSEKTQTTLKSVRDGLLDSMEKAVKPSTTEKDTRTSVPTPTDNVYARIDPLLDIDISASERTNVRGDNIIVEQPRGFALFKFSIKNPPSGTERKPVEIIITLKPSASRYLYFTVNGRKYTAFLDGFGRKSLGITSDMLTDNNTLAIAGDSDLVISKEMITIAKF